MPIKTARTHYTVLGISEAATQEEVKNAYKRNALLLHPDRHRGDDDSTAAEVHQRRFQEMVNAYEVLKDAASRQAYDRRLHPVGYRWQAPRYTRRQPATTAATTSTSSANNNTTSSTPSSATASSSPSPATASSPTGCPSFANTPRPSYTSPPRTPATSGAPSPSSAARSTEPTSPAASNATDDASKSGVHAGPSPTTPRSSPSSCSKPTAPSQPSLWEVFAPRAYALYFFSTKSKSAGDETFFNYRGRPCVRGTPRRYGGNRPSSNEALQGLYDSLSDWFEYYCAYYEDVQTAQAATFPMLWHHLDMCFADMECEAYDVGFRGEEGVGGLDGFHTDYVHCQRDFPRTFVMRVFKAKFGRPFNEKDA